MSATGTGDVSYQWFLNDGEITDAKSREYAANIAGNYTVKVTSTLGGSSLTVTSNSAILTVQGVRITSISPDAFVTQGRTTPLSVGVSTFPSVVVTYQWKLDDTDVSNSNSQTFLAASAGDYTVLVTGTRNGFTQTATSSAVRVTAVAAPSITSFDSLNSSIASGGSTNLVPVFAGGTGVITPGDIAVTSGDSISVSPLVTTTYRLGVTNAAGSSIGMSYTVTVTTGTFTNVSNAMSVSRIEGSTSIALVDGRVLIYGNHNGSGTKIADVFDPTTNVFTRTGDLNSARRNAPGILLGDGKVLVTGGITYQVKYGSLSSAELFDPGTNTWTSTGSMGTTRRSHFMVRLTNGKILVGGGTNDNGTILQSTEIYDPATGLFTAAPDMPQIRTDAHAALLSNGHVIIFGGYSGTGAGYLKSAIIFDVTTNTWRTITSQMQGHHGQGATLTVLNDGRMVIAGGWVVDGGSYVGSSQVDIFDPTTETFSNGPALTERRADLTAHLLSDGKVVFIGGSDGTGGIWSTVDVYDPVSQTMTRQFNTMRGYRRSHSSALLQDGRVLIVGGSVSNDTTGEIFTK